MKKVLLIIGAGACLAVAVILSMALMANRVGNSVQSDFFAVVATNDPETFFEACDPRMRDEIDAPLLQQWMHTVNERLGAYQGLDPADFHSATRFDEGNRIVETSGTVKFQHGTAQSSLSYVNGKLAQFNVRSDLLSDDWFQSPDDTTMYRALAETFYSDLTTGATEEAYRAMSAELQNEISPEDFESLAERINVGLGKVDAINFVAEEFDASTGSHRLTLRFQLVGEANTYDANISFLFDGLKAHFVEFNAAPAIPLPSDS